MNTQTKLVKKLIYVAGVASASIGLSLPAFALSPTVPVNSANSSANIRELVAQGGSGPGSATPGKTSTDTPPGGSGDNAPTSGTPAPNSGTNTNAGGGSDNMGGSSTSSPSTPSGSSSNTSSSTNRNDLKPGTWLCLNNPNPQCKG